MLCAMCLCICLLLEFRSRSNGTRKEYRFTVARDGTPRMLAWATVQRNEWECALQYAGSF